MIEIKMSEKIMQESCEDRISREAVGYYIQSHIHEIITESGTDKNEHTNSILRAILNGIKTMPSVTPQPRWIPVSERLPMMGDTFLVTIEYKGEVIGVDAASYSPVEGYIDKHWDTFNDWKEDDDSCYHVTAWVPLPEPYKTETKIEQGLSFGDQDTMMPAT